MIKPSPKNPVIFTCPNCECVCKEKFTAVKPVSVKGSKPDFGNPALDIAYTAICPLCGATMSVPYEQYKCQPTEPVSKEQSAEPATEPLTTEDRKNRPNIHLSRDDAQRLLKWFQAYKEKVEDTLCLGDEPLEVPDEDRLLKNKVNVVIKRDNFLNHRYSPNA